MVADIQFNHALSQFLAEYANVQAMVAASDAGRPAVEAIGAPLLGQFGDRVRPEPIRQRIGQLVRPIMESQGFEPYKRKPANCVLFTSGTVYRAEPRSISAALNRYDIDLPDDVIRRELRAAAESAIGNPPFVSPNQRIDWSVLVSASPRHEPREPLRAFVTAMGHELRQQECRRTTAKPNKQLSVEDRRRLGLDDLNQRQPIRHLPRVRTALKVGALYATGFTIHETARMLDFDERTVLDWTESRLLYGTPIGPARPTRLALFQFDADGLVPKVQNILPLLNSAIHPVGVFNWFTHPNPDLALDETNFEPTSPRDWLRHRYSAEPVCRLAATVPVGIAA